MRHVSMKVCTAILCVWLALSLAVTPVLAEEKTDTEKLVLKIRKDRARTLCRAVLRAWLKQSVEGQGFAFKATVADCYVAHARLAAMGVPDRIVLEGVRPTDLPSALLAHETGMKLDVYGPLAGRILKDYAGKE